MGHLRWPKSLHSQMESVFATIRGLGEKKSLNTGGIRSVGTWRSYRSEAHRFAKYLQSRGVSDLRAIDAVQQAAKEYMAERLAVARLKGHSHQTQQARASAFAALERGFNRFFEQRNMPLRLDLKESCREYLTLSRAYLSTRQEYQDGTRAYPDPARLVSAIRSEAHALQASLQYQGGMRSEGVGAPSGIVRNPFTIDNLQGYRRDIVSGKRVGLVATKEKGGKWTSHFIPKATYERLEAYLKEHERLESRYQDYRNAVITAAKITGQYAPGRATHGLKTAFAKHRYAECVKHGFSHERAMQQTSWELSHNRWDITLIYTRG